MKILILIRALTTGGAERQAALLAKGLKRRGHQIKIVVFYGGGALEADLAETAIPIIDLGKKGRWDTAPFLWRLGRALQQEQPDVLYSFLTVSNLLNGLFCPFAPPCKAVWGLRASNMDPTHYDWIHCFTMALEARFARHADLIIANSQAGRDFAVTHNFPSERMTVIRNGIDTAKFRPDIPAGKRVREEWGISPSHRLIGLIGRLDPMKGHSNFIHAAEQLSAQYPNLRFVCVGEGPVDYQTLLQTEARALGLGENLCWVGIRQDMPAVYNALDLAVSASLFGEGVSNMIGEAMACGIPCVTTDVGDSAWMVGETGVVVIPGQPEALAQGIQTQLERLERQGESLGLAARQHIETHLSVDALIDNTIHALERLP